MDAKILSKLTAKGIRITGEGFGGVAELTPEMVAQALSGLGRSDYLYALFKYVIMFDLRSVRGERSQDRKTVQVEYFDRMPVGVSALAAEMIGLVFDDISEKYDDWHNIHESTLYHAIKTALWELIDPRFNMCRKCGGTGKNSWGTISTGRPARDCKACDGKGVIRKSGADYSRKLGIDRSNWARCWERRYEKLLIELGGIDDRVQRHIRKRLIEVA